MEDKPENIILFPRKNINTVALKSLEEIRAESVKNKIVFVDDLVENLVADMIYKLGMEGIEIDITQTKYLKDVGLMVESIKSFILRTMNIEHPIQMAADKLITIDELPVSHNND